MSIEPHPSLPDNQRHFSGWQVIFIVLFCVSLTAGFTVWLMYSQLFVTEFNPVVLNDKEQQSLTEKLQQLEASSAPAGSTLIQTPEYKAPSTHNGGLLEPERYSEVGATREISLTEKELNAMLAKNTDLAKKLAIDLSGELASAKMLIPLDPEFPILGGNTLKVSAGLALAYNNGVPVVALKGVSVWGVPLPNAWLGGIKNVDLVEHYGASAGFWKSFSEGIEHILVEEGMLKIKLKE